MSDPPIADRGSEHAGDGVSGLDFVQVLEHAPVMAYLLRSTRDDFVLEAVNAIARERSPALSSMIGRKISLLYRDQPELIADAWRCLQERRTVVREIAVRRHDRLEADQQQRVVFVFVAPARLVIYAHDIATLANAEVARLESEERYRSLVASLPDGVLVRGVDGRVLACNQVAVELFGRKTQAEMLGRLEVLADGFAIEDERGHHISDAELPSIGVARTGVPALGRMLKVIAPDGSKRFVRVSAQPIRMHSGTLGGSVALYTDETMRINLEDELRRAHRLESIGRLAGGIAHDFNNLLAAMLGSLELLGECCPVEGLDELSSVRHAVERARDLTAQLLAFARKQPIVLQVVEVADLVAKIERMMRRLVGPTIELSVAVEPGLHVRADAAQLEQVFVNLLVNARDAMPHGGRLAVRARGEAADANAEQVVIEVEDSGVGMDAVTVRHIFDPFFTTKQTGTGLGLASSYGTIQQHGGNIHVDSEPGRGSRFRVTLPRTQEPSPAPKSTRQQTGGAGCILVVDDEEAVRQVTARLLKTLGYEVLQASGGEDAVRVARAQPAAIDVLLCDVAMPELSGPEVAARVREVWPNILTLFVSGYPEGGESAVSSGAFLQKPYTRAALAAKLALLRSQAP